MFTQQSLQPHDTTSTDEFRDYVYSVSHDVGAPVRAMVEFSRLLADEHAKDLNDDGRLYLSLIVENGEKLQHMMEGLLEYSRLNTEAQPFGPVDCMKPFKNAMITLDDIIRKTRAQIECNTLPEIEGDGTQIWQLFTALLDNALKFQPLYNTPCIKVTAEEQGNFWQFSFADNGIGIDKRFHKKIFQLFQRLHASEEYTGVGIGLTLARKVIHRHGGTIWIKSTEENGSTFVFTLPKRCQMIESKNDPLP